MTNNGVFRRTFLSLAIFTWLVFLSSVPLAAPVIGPLGADDAAIANQLLNEILTPRSSGNIAAGTSDSTVAGAGSMVVELMNAARPFVLAVLRKAEISGELEVRTGTFFSGFIPSAPGVNGSRHIDLLIYQNGNRLGDLTVGKQYSGSSVTPYAEFARTR
jgi:hypothetical protein